MSIRQIIFMFRRVFNVYRLRAAARYWRRRFEASERRVAELLEVLAIETERNREREDTFASASTLGTRNMYGIPPRYATKRDVPQPKQDVSPDPMFGLSLQERLEWEGVWKPDAEASGINLQQALQQFREVASSRKINDVPDYS